MEAALDRDPGPAAGWAPRAIGTGETVARERLLVAPLRTMPRPGILEAPVTKLRGAGPKLAAAAAEIGISDLGDLLRHLPHIASPDAQEGDLVVWGRYPGRHCAVLVEPGDDPLLVSHGSERGPLEVRFSVEQHVHDGQPTTWLNGLPLRNLSEQTPVPSPTRAATDGES